MRLESFVEKMTVSPFLIEQLWTWGPLGVFLIILGVIIRWIYREIKPSLTELSKSFLKRQTDMGKRIGALEMKVTKLDTELQFWRSCPKRDCPMGILLDGEEVQNAKT